MKQSKLMFVVGIVVLASMILSACQPVVTTVEVTSVVKQTQVVEQTKVVNQTSVVENTKIVQVERKPFTTPHPILSDLKVRKALSYCTNKLELIKSVYPTLTADQQKALIINSFVPSNHWAYAGDANLTIYPFQQDVGKSLLQDAGWVDDGAGGRANKAGESLTLKFTTTTAAFRQTWAAVFQKQMADCGVTILRFHVPASWWFGATTGLARRDFELGAYAWVGEADPKGDTLYACKNIPTPENGWVGQNYMGWCNEKASQAVVAAVNTLKKEDRVNFYKIVQQEYTKDIPTIPLFNRTEIYAYNPKLTNFKPSGGELYYDWNVYEWQIPGKDTFVLGFTQEPASMFTQNETAWVQRLADTMVSGYLEHIVNYDYVPLLVKQLATIDNKKAVLNTVDVKEGDKVWDLDGALKELKAGVKVKDATGADVEYKSGTVKMPQLVVTYELIDGLKWSDGEAVKKEDLELGYKIRCDKTNGSPDFTTCDATSKVDFLSDTALTSTYVPGYTASLYYLFPFPIYPAHQVVASDGPNKGKKLADVIAKDWPTLKETAETPMGFGPYVLKEWKKTQSMTFEANKYWVFGAPKTSKMVISFITPENIDAQLLAGQVDFVGSESLTDKTQKLADAEKAGKVKVEVFAGATWEHIDLSLFVK